jgi:signal transduction histidine kinase
VEQALRRALERISRYLNWPVAHAWLPSGNDPQSFVSSGVWYLNPPEAYRIFVEETARLTYRAGQGLVGDVLGSRSPKWIEDLPDAKGLIRAESFHAAGLRSAAAFPIVVRDRIAAVLEFFDGSFSEPMEILLEGMKQFGIELGRVFERQDLQREIARISEEEQRRFSHQLHDSVAQELTGIGMMAQSLYQDAAEQRPIRVDVAEKLVLQIAETQRQVRNLSRGLMPVELDAEGLASALQVLAERMCESSGIHCRLEAPRPVRIESASAATHLYHIAQEAMHNAIKHAEASEVVVWLDRTEPSAGGESAVTLTVRDNGRGIGSNGGSDGMGHRIMRYRANLIGAQLKIESQPRQGTTVTCRLPQTAAQMLRAEPAGE